MMCRLGVMDTSCHAFYAAIIFGIVHEVFDGYEDGPTSDSSPHMQLQGSVRFYEGV